ncbi:oligoendopeptidase F [Macrococcoides caseolyticum]|uniref:Oligoendopeptidase F n=1 Tax=Macrococcoides caseolyticum TaxID=69966 RepID=A0ACC9MVB1_9STAP|nr:oligoendopeptidase F [Macrococcus caseolyticus]PKE12500.1 oligoendopeptidase F [Macrococcus caseolyticus]PKE19259.1 oligoendopeptidase F [Macrococcus caseolyticus]PKE40197.1 oligoendopeptidase F [Macrococcus caseolyticus]PKE49034.1 oligoendopeptidase F [Macrococcus caseolyticus]PKE57365.1 oligoendopeptidase F [Macrococcus caseolyticus]
MSELITRDEQKLENTWDLTTIFASDEDWERAFKKLEGYLGREEEIKGKIGDSAENLLEALLLDAEIDEQLGKVYVYAHLKHDQDTSNAKYTAFEQRAANLASQFSARWSFMLPELMSIDEATLKSYVAELDGLKRFAFDLERINKKRPHVLSESEEKILAEASEALSASTNTFGMFNNADLKFDNVKDKEGNSLPLSHGNYITYLESDDRVLRENAYKEVYSKYGQFNNTLAQTLAGKVKASVFSSKVRNYESARAQALSNNDIPETVYDNLVQTVNDNLHLLHRYTKLRKELLGLDEMHMYDMYTPVIQDEKFEVTYEEAKAWMLKSLEPMGSEYTDVIKEGLTNRWVDVYENKGKRSGAYSSGTFGTNPFILMNWTDSVNNTFTLTHEFGHSAHSYFSRNNQPSNMSGYSIFVAEVASTCNEALLADYMYKHLDDDKKKLYLLNYQLDGFRGTVFRQTMFAEFEYLIHTLAEQNEPLTAERLNAEYRKLNEKYYGDAVITDDYIQYEWSRIPHFYYNYYVYQYATGYSAAYALSKKILEEGQPAVDKYINEFLKAGSSDYPIEVLKKAGVDMNEKTPIENACKVFEERLDAFEALIKSRS